jgi:hypothetical protein
MKNVRRIEFAVVPASKIHFSTILPRKSPDDEVLRSVERYGIQLPLIVRPLKENPEEYELIDGTIRRFALKKDQRVLVEIRYGVTDSEVFRIREAISKRKRRTTRESAAFYSYWVQIVSEERGEKGAQARVARIARMSEGEISQYLAIHNAFRELERLPKSATINLDTIENQGINKLYELSKLRGNPALLTIAQEFAKHPNMPIRKLRHKIKNEKIFEATKK